MLSYNFSSLTQDPSCSSFLSQCVSTASCRHGRERPPCACPFSSVAPFCTGNKAGCYCLLLHADTRKISTPWLCQPITTENTAASFPLPPTIHSPILQIKGNQPTPCWRGSCLEVWLAFPPAASGAEGESTPHPGGARDISRPHGGSGWHKFSVAKWFCQAWFFTSLEWYVCLNFR